MSFKKSYLNFDKIVSLYKQGGIALVKKYFSSVDAFIFQDDESHDLFMSIWEGDDKFTHLYNKLIQERE